MKILNTQPEIVSIRTKIYSQCCVLLYVADKVQMAENNFSRFCRDQGRQEARQFIYDTRLFDKYLTPDDRRNMEWLDANEKLDKSIADITRQWIRNNNLSISDDFDRIEKQVSRGIAEAKMLRAKSTGT